MQKLSCVHNSILVLCALVISFRWSLYTMSAGFEQRNKRTLQVFDPRMVRSSICECLWIVITHTLRHSEVARETW